MWSEGAMKIYTRKGDGGTTGLYFGGRVSKDSAQVELLGCIDESQAALGLARAECAPGSALETRLVELERELWVVMAEVATSPERRDRLVAGETKVVDVMVAGLEEMIDELDESLEMPSEFVVPGQNRVSALLDWARVVVRRAERRAVGAGLAEGSLVGPYLNRLSDLLWMLARWQEGDLHLLTRGLPRTLPLGDDPVAPPGPGASGPGAGASAADFGEESE